MPCSPEPPTGYCAYDGQVCDYSVGSCGGEQCVCENGEWECAVGTCPPPSCPPAPPPPGTACSDEGLSCGWGNNGGGCGGEQCDCYAGYWECSISTCPPPTCPAEPPGNQDACNQFGSVCDYPINNNVCSDWECACYPSGVWDCYETDCGGQDGGISVDAGFGI